MEVNIKAVSDALDGILALDAQDGYAMSQRQNSAIIHRQQPQTKPEKPKAFSNNDSRPNTNENVVTAVSAVLPRVREPTTSTMRAGASEKPNKAAEKASQRHVNNSGEQAESSERASFVKSAEKSSLSPESVRSRRRDESKAATSSVFIPDDATRNFFADLRAIRAMNVKCIEASGLGAASVLVTPRNAKKRLETTQLPSKSWATNTTLAPCASAVFEVEDHESLIRRRPTSPARRHAPQSNVGASVQDLGVLLLLDCTSDSRSNESEQLSPTRRDALSYNVTIETSSFKNRGFISACAACATTNDSFLRLIIPGTLLSPFIRVSVRASGNYSPAKLIRVRALCFFHSRTWTAERHDRINDETETRAVSLEDELQAALHEEPAQQPPFIEPLRASPPSHRKRLTTPPAEEFFDQQKVKNGAHSTERAGGVVHSKTDAIQVADFVKSEALSELCRDSDAKPHDQKRTSEVNWEYNWFSDQLVPIAPDGENARRQNLRDEGRAHDSDDIHFEPSATTEYIHTMQAWNSVPVLTTETALESCLSHTTSFSASTITAESLFCPSAALHLAQPFKLHALVVCGLKSNQGNGAHTAPTTEALPPLHILSAIANHAGHLGYTSELLFTCTANSGFACAFRPEDSTSTSSNEQYKLLFVAVKHSKGEPFVDCSDAATNLLTLALTVFQKSTSGIQSKANRCVFPVTSRLSPAARLPPPCGALKMFLDGTNTFERLTPILGKWAQAAGPIRYYGDAAQRVLQLLLSPLQFIESSDCDTRQSKFSGTSQWTNVRVELSGVWAEDSFMSEGDGKEIVALQLQAHAPATYVWQSAPRQRESMRLILTDAHLLEDFTSVNGLVVSPNIGELVHRFCSVAAGSGGTAPPVAPLSEAPWLELLEVAKKVLSRSLGTAACNSVADFFALRRQITISFAFHVLSTAFKRGWSRVSTAIPTCTSIFQTVASGLQNVGGVDAGYDARYSCLTAKPVSLLDEDAFMDTIVQWSYPLPSIVTLHCTDVFHPAPPPSALSDKTDDALEASGVASLFSPETLCNFAYVTSLSEALA